MSTGGDVTPGPNSPKEGVIHEPTQEEEFVKAHAITILMKEWLKNEDILMAEPSYAFLHFK